MISYKCNHLTGVDESFKLTEVILYM